MKIKDFCTVCNGSTPSSQHPEYYGGNIVWLTPKDLSDQNTKYVEKGERNITDSGYNSCSTQLIPPYNVLMSSRAPIGLLAINKVECCTNQGFKNFIIDKSKCNVDYLFYFFKYHIKEIEALGSGTTFKEVSKSSIENYEVDTPQLSAQKKIAGVLSYIDSKIENNNRINAELEAMAKTIYDYWFLQFEFPDENGKPYKSSGGKMIWNEELKREIPEGWKATTIGDITICHDSERIPVANRDREKMKGNIPYYGATEIMGYVDRPIFSGNYVLMAEDGSVMDSKGHPILQRITGDTWVNNHAHVLEPIKNHSCKLLMMFLKDVYVPTIKTGSIQMKINQENMNGIKIPEIPDKLKLMVNQSLQTIDDSILKKQKENQELTSLRDFLLPLLMNGQVGFNNAE